MAMNVGGRRKGAIAEINVTPMADVMIVLLIIFMVMTPIIVNPVRVPDAANATEQKGERLEVTLGTNGLITAGMDSFGSAEAVRADTFTLNTTPYLTREALAERLRAALEERRDPTVFVKVEGGVVYDRVIEAMDVAREAGAARIGLVDEATPSR